MTHFPAHIAPVEAQIINRILTSALANGGMVSVHDGEEWAIKHSTNRATIQGATAATDETLLVCRLADGTKVGAVQLIHGNGPDVVCDYHDTPAMEALMAKANAYAENA